MERIAVVGLGYVGLPVALAFARKFPGTIGFDIHEEKVRELARGEAPARVLELAGRTAPEGAHVEVARSGGDVTVTVTSPTPVGVSFVAPESSCSSTARVESVDVGP